LSSPPLESESASAASQPANGSKLKGWHDGRYYVDGFDCTPSPAFVALLRGEYVPDDPYCSNGADIAEQAIDPGESDSLLTLSCETAKSLENNDTAIATGSDPVNPALNPPSFMAGDPSNSGAPAISRSREPLPDWLVGTRRNPTIAPPAPAAIPAVAPRRAPAAHADGSNVIHLADVRPKHGESL